MITIFLLHEAIQYFFSRFDLQAVFTAAKPVTPVFQVETSYLTGFPRGLNAASDTKSLFCRNVRLFDLSAEKTSWKAKHSRHGTNI